MTNKYLQFAYDKMGYSIVKPTKNRHSINVNVVGFNEAKLFHGQHLLICRRFILRVFLGSSNHEATMSPLCVCKLTPFLSVTG